MILTILGAAAVLIAAIGLFYNLRTRRRLRRLFELESKKRWR